MSLVERTPTPGERLYAEWCDAPGSDGERYWIAMNRADKAAWEKLGARVAADRGAVEANRALGPAAVTAAHELAQAAGERLRRELVADMLAAAHRAARGQ